MRILTEDQLAEVDRIINETEVETYYEGEDSVEVDDAKGTLRAAAVNVRKYLSSLEMKEAVNARS
jgi:hypothetical protein